MNEVNFGGVKSDTPEYIGVYGAPKSGIRELLTAVTSEYGIDILKNPSALRRAMDESGAMESEICQVCLMTQVSGFRELLKQDEGTMQVDLDRYIWNATEETGFRRDTILSLTSSIMSAAGKDMPVTPSGAVHQFPPQTIAALAVPLYEKQLRAFQTDFERVLFKGASIKLNFEKLEPLVSLGVPQAEYYLGFCLLNGIQLEENRERGLELLEAAASMGSSKAASALGDCYYAGGGSDNWTKAYQYYTGYGAAALNRSQRSALTSIINHGIFNRKLLALCIVLLLLSAAAVIWPPAAEIYGPHPVLGWLAVLLQLGLLVLGVLRYRDKPYGSFYGLPAAMSGVWTVYLAIRFLF